MSEDEGSPVLGPLRGRRSGVVGDRRGIRARAVAALLRQADALAPHSVVLGGFILFFIVLLLPVVFALVMPMISRARYGSREVNRVIR